LAYSLFRGYSSALVTDVQFVSASSQLEPTAYTDLEQILVINSSNGTSHIYNLKRPKKVNETPISKKLQNGGNDSKVIPLMPKSRFKYKSLIKTGALKVVSMVGCVQPGQYRILTYTSKNEFFVIDVSKGSLLKKGGPKQQLIDPSNTSRLLN
jgi:hypothetical protein